jgi:hypothetical protein
MSGKRHHNPEGSLARREVPGAVERIDDPTQGPAKPTKDVAVEFGRFFPDDAGFWGDAGQALGEHRLAFAVGDGDQLVGRFLEDVVAGELAVARKKDSNGRFF